MILKKLKTAAAVTLSGIMLTGCVNLLEDYKETITDHQSIPYVRPPIEQISVSDYDEFIAVILDHIMEYVTDIHMLYYHPEEAYIQADIQRARHEIIYEHPIGAYAVAEITANTTRIVTHYEIDIQIEYKRTREQLDSIVNVSTEQAIRMQLLRKMSEHAEEAVFRSRLQLNEETIAELVRNTYYQNPRNVVMLPMITVETFPEEGSDRVYEIQFGYIESPGMLQHFGTLLTLYVQQNAELADGETESEVILSLVNNLIESTSFDEAAARTIHAHGVQNFAATAVGAFVRGTAVGEGFAMAFKALADELGFDCRVVLGDFDGLVHAWNIISLYGDFYHIDVAMCRVLGLETSFLKTDADLEEMLYTWDRENTVYCEGELTLEDILGDDDPGEDDNNGEESNEENEEEEDFVYERRKRVL